MEGKVARTRKEALITKREHCEVDESVCKLRILRGPRVWRQHVTLLFLRFVRFPSERLSVKRNLKQNVSYLSTRSEAVTLGIF